MRLPFTHPPLASLVAFADGELVAASHARVARHVQRCPRCQDTLRFLRRLRVEASTMPDARAPERVLARVLEHRAAGERAILSGILPSLGVVEAPTQRWARWAVAAAAVLIVASMTLLMRTPELAAVVQDSELVMTPERPRPGDTIHVRFTPAAGMFEQDERLVLRARLRTARHEMYNEGVPVAELAALRRTRANEFAGSFALPASIVFASLAVEDTAAQHIDTNGGRLWEVLFHAPDGRPQFASLAQRANDMMGRSWEEGYATARRMTELYPEVLESWNSRLSFERALFGDDSAQHSATAQRLQRLTANAKQAPQIDEQSMGSLFYNAFERILRGGSPEDSAEVHYWWERLRRAYPRHPQVAQRTAIEIGQSAWDRPQEVLDSLKRALPNLAPLFGPGRTRYLVAMQAANRLGDDAEARRWMELWQAGRPDSTIELALFAAEREPLRADAMHALRELMRRPVQELIPVRGLEASREAHRRSAEDERRRLAAALGRALIAEGALAAGRDTLLLAAEGAWDPTLFREIRSALLAAGDSGGAQAMSIRLAVDPRTSRAEADSIAAAVRLRVGENGWETAAAQARGEMHRRLLARSRNSAPRGVARLVANGDRRTLGEITGRTPAVVILWSRNCGAAIEALPRIQATARRLIALGTPVLMVVDESPSVSLTSFLEEHKVSIPVYHDSDGSTRAALSGFGTPAYYVIDAAGRIRFDRVREEDELLALVQALRHEGMVSGR